MSGRRGQPPERRVSWWQRDFQVYVPKEYRAPRVIARPLSPNPPVEE